MENKNLSPKALSKQKHKISSWVTPSLKKNFNIFFNECKQLVIFDSKSEIVSEAIIQEYFSNPYEKKPKSIYSDELSTCRITFYLIPEVAQHLWDLESHYLGKGINVTCSFIVQVALERFIENFIPSPLLPSSLR